MAKKKLTTEEKLQAALVPEEEQPYKVPENWCWVRLGALASDMADGPFGSNLKTEHYTDKREARIIQLSNIGEEGWREENTRYTTFEHAKKIERSIVIPGDIVIAKMMPAGRAIICPNNEEMYILSSDAVRMTPIKPLDVKYLVYAINSPHFRNQVQENTQGITRARTSIKKLKMFPFALPPLCEQSRIVARIESLFAKLDEAKEKIQEVLDGADLRRAAILHQAFTGKLTEKWRKENDVADGSWEEHTLGEVCRSIYDGDHMPPPKAEDGIPFLVISNVNTGYLSFENTRYVNEEYFNNLTDTRKPEKGDVLYTLVGSYGIPVVVDTDRPFCFQRHMALLKPETVQTRYLWYVLQTKEFFYKATKIATGTAQLTVPIKKLRELSINVPSMLEQQEIVRLLDNLLSNEQSTVTACESALDTIDTLKKSILARAFRGELGTNDPSEASAKELLKEILA